MNVIKIGTECHTKIGNYKGIITEINIRHEGVVYNVSYENEGIRNAYFCEFELILDNIEYTQIGFKL